MFQNVQLQKVSFIKLFWIKLVGHKFVECDGNCCVTTYTHNGINYITDVRYE